MLKFGDTELKNGLILAPLSGITDSSFRKICKSFGAELVFSEMVSAEGISRRMRRSIEYLNFDNRERPIGIQIFGSKPDSMREAAKIIENEFCPDVIDINIGCPVKKVTKTGAGAALLKDLQRLKEIVKSVVSSVEIPVSAKIRVGWDKENYKEVSKILEGCGISFLTVHARRAKDSYNKKADWSVFERMKKDISIPIVANGDIEKPENATYLLDEIGVDAIMIGRGAIGKPWIFENMKSFIENGCVRGEPSIKERIDVLLRQIEMMKKSIGEGVTVRRIKKQVGYYLKKVPKGKDKKQEILSVKKLEDMIEILLDLQSEL